MPQIWGRFDQKREETQESTGSGLVEPTKGFHERLQPQQRSGKARTFSLGFGIRIPGSYIKSRMRFNARLRKPPASSHHPYPVTRTPYPVTPSPIARTASRTIDILPLRIRLSSDDHRPEHPTPPPSPPPLAGLPSSARCLFLHRRAPLTESQPRTGETR